jgi:dTMP kinase
MDPMAELLLYSACRVQHVQEVLLPELEAGSVVLCDRFFDATVAYQGFGRGLDIRLVKEINSLASRGLCPDLTILLDCPVEVGLRRSWRRIKRDGSFDESRFEREEKEFHQRVREGYLSLARMEPNRIKVVEGTGSEELIHLEIRGHVLEVINPCRVSESGRGILNGISTEQGE